MFLLLVLLAAGLQSLDCRENVRPEISRLNFFDTDLLRYAAEDTKGNVLVSPASIKSILAMILEVSRGNTEAEIKSALRLSPYKDEVRDQLNLYLNALYANTSGVNLQNSNGIFVSDKLKLKKDYEQAIRNIYYSTVISIDFGNPVSAADTINRWVSEHTKGLITDLVQSGEINPTSEALLTNALFFKGFWRYAFNPKYTRVGCFYNEGSCQKVAMMELYEDLYYAFVDNLRAHALELPYQGDRYSMIILVPQDRTGLNTLIRDLPYMSLPQISMLMELTSMRLHMPKFTVDYTESMVEPLRKMKISTLFTKNSNLSGMFENGSAQVNNFLHKVHLAVDENGTVAAAASSAMVIPLIEDGVQLKVDRPFVFFIRDNLLELILFEGKIEEPTAYVEEKVLGDPSQGKNGQVHLNAGQNVVVTDESANISGFKVANTGDRYSMIILVPQDRNGLNTLIRDLPYMSLPQISMLMELTNMRLHMPKFTVDYTESMVEPLRKMKISTLFTKNSNLSGMFENGSAQVNNFLHKVHLAVDENGTVAPVHVAPELFPKVKNVVIFCYAQLTKIERF